MNLSEITAEEADQIVMRFRPFEHTTGRLLMNFGALEILVLNATATIAAKSSPKYLKYEIPCSFGNSINLFTKVVKLVLPEALREEHDKLITEIRALITDRNKVVHGP
jgi:hypothetical protein